MGLAHRPYIGTWELNQKQVVQYTPDCLVYVNGDTSLPGCPKCNGRIDLQQFITEVSVDAGTTPGDASCTFSLTLPIHHLESFSRDARYILRPGLEVHVYMRGYFPVRGMYENLGEPGTAISRDAAKTTVTVSGFEPAPEAVAEEGAVPRVAPGVPYEEWGTRLSDIDFGKVPYEQLRRGGMRLNQGGDIEKRSWVAAGSAAVIEAYWKQKFPDAQVVIKSHYRVPVRTLPDGTVIRDKGNHSRGAAIDYQIQYTDPDTGVRKTVPALQTWAGTNKLRTSGRLPPGSGGLYMNISSSGAKGTLPEQAGRGSRPGMPPGGSASPHYDYRGTYSFRPGSAGGAKWIWLDTDGDGRDDYRSASTSLQYLRSQGSEFSWLLDYYQSDGQDDPFLPDVTSAVPNLLQVLGQQGFDPTPLPTLRAESVSPEEGADVAAEPVDESILEQLGLGESGLEDVLAYPYYHVFHGVITQVEHAWNGGFFTGSVSCSSMLHFWQYHTMSTNASLFGARPTNSQLRMTLLGHNFSGMHPYEIMWTLHNDMVGAAGGVGWALSSKTNVAKKTEILGESLFSLNIRYWERRFNTKQIRLRMHAATGELFSAAQAAFVGRLGSHTLTRVVQDRFGSPYLNKSNKRMRILRASQFLGLFNKDRLEALQARGLVAEPTGEEGATTDDFTLGLERPSRNPGPRLEINMVEMQAFVANIADWGQVNLFESAYESKLDIAQKVMEVTGFEFYQDVDGDFVFKPPFYNLDTSGSRVYRLEDIDLISLTFAEREPEVTYMIVKNGFFHNLHGANVDNEWGNRGQYIDYRLVAQFGWRPGTYETSYFNNPTSLFFCAVNRMDLLNAPVNSASAVIPLRPELRPGYPIYIPYLDCFYYCNSFAHQYSVGGQCTTSIQLIAKRAKFYAPGDVTKEGVEAINLANTLLPQRPLEIHDEEGRPRLSGFPNVVMALDPSTINPLFFVVGADIESINDPQILGSVIQIGLSMRLINVSEYRGSNEAVYSFQIPSEKDSGQSKTVYFSFRRVELNAEPTEETFGKKTKRTSGPPVANLQRAAQRYVTKQKAFKSKLARQNDRAADIQSEIISLYRAEREKPSGQPPSAPSGGKKDATSLEAQVEKLLREKRKIEDLLKKSQERFQQELREDRENWEIQTLLDLIGQVGEQYIKTHGEIGDINSTWNLLDMLSDKKASFSTGNQPGSYRYYSASHPDPKLQGQPVVRRIKPRKGSPEAAQGATIVKQEKSSLPAPVPVVGYLPSRQIVSSPGATTPPEAQFGVIQAQNGIRVLTADPKAPDGKVLPTSDIRELMFAVQYAEFRRNRTVTNTATLTEINGSGIKKALTTLWSSISPGDGDRISSVMGQLWDKVGRTDAGTNVWTTASSPPIPPLSAPVYPSVVTIRSLNIAVGGTASETFSSAVAEIRQRGNQKYTKAQFLVDLASALASSYSRQALRQIAIWKRNAREVYLSKTLRGSDRYQEAVNNLLSRLSSIPGITGVDETETAKYTVPQFRQEKIFSPVFPVSDAAGYEVVGSYRYGRDIDIDPNGVFDVLHRQDPFSLLDRDTVERLLQFIVKGEYVREAVSTTNKRGKKKTTYRIVFRPKDAQTFNAFQKTVLASLRKRMSDQMIIDLGLAVRNKTNPSQIDFNMMNWFADDSREGIRKLPVSNAAYALADLTHQTQKRLCSCKAAEANSLLEAFGQTGFLEFSSGASRTQEGEETDVATEWLTAVTAQAGASWKKNQDALRGAVLDRAGSTLLQSFADPIEAFGFTEVAQRQNRALEGLRQGTAALEETLGGDDE